MDDTMRALAEVCAPGDCAVAKAFLGDVAAAVALAAGVPPDAVSIAAGGDGFWTVTIFARMLRASEVGCARVAGRDAALRDATRKAVGQYRDGVARGDYGPAH